MQNPKNMAGILIALLFVHFGFTEALYAAVSSEELGDPERVSNVLPAMVKDVSARIHTLINDGAIYRHAMVLLAFGDVMLVLHTGYVWSKKKCDIDDIKGTIFILVCVNFLFANFGPVTLFIFQYMDQLGLLVQEALVGDSSVFGPHEFLVKLYGSFVTEKFNMLSFNVDALLYTVLFFLLSVLLEGASWLMATWGVVGYLVIMPLGLLFLPTMLHHKISFVFEGWLRLFFGFCLYGLIAKTIICVVTIMLAYTLEVQWGVAPENSIMLYPHTSAQILAITIISLFLMLSAPWFVGSILQNAFQGLGGGIKTAALAASRIG